MLLGSVNGTGIVFSERVNARYIHFPVDHRYHYDPGMEGLYILDTLQADDFETCVSYLKEQMAQQEESNAAQEEMAQKQVKKAQEEMAQQQALKNAQCLIQAEENEALQREQRRNRKVQKKQREHQRKQKEALDTAKALVRQGFKNLLRLCQRENKTQQQIMKAAKTAHDHVLCKAITHWRWVFGLIKKCKATAIKFYPELTIPNARLPDEDYLCVVCLDRPKEYLIYPCGHKCLCGVCMEKFVSGKECPVCREHVNGTCKVFT